MKAKAIEDGILFTFVEETSGGAFENATDWGFVVQSKVEDPTKPRWAKVIDVGPKVKLISKGQYILVENLMWTTSLSLNENDEKFWKTNEKHVMCVSDEYPEF